MQWRQCKAIIIGVDALTEEILAVPIDNGEIVVVEDETSRREPDVL